MGSHGEDERRGGIVEVFPRLPAKFVGRREELEWLYNGLRMSIRDSRATRLFIHGEAGVGKTRLINEFLSLVEPERKGVQVIRLQISHHSAADANGLLSELTHKLWPLVDGTSESERANGVRTELESMSLGRDTGARINQLLRTLGIQGENVDSGEGLHHEFTPESTFGLFGDILRSRASIGPLFLYLDGAQWLHRETRAGWSSLVKSMEQAPALVVMNSRDAPGVEFQDLELEVRLLKPLSESEGLKLCWGLMEGVENTDEGVFTELLSRSGGLPGLLEDLVALLSQRGIVVKTVQGGYRCLPGRMEGVTLPDTLGESSEARMNALHRRQRQVLEMACVFGERFWSGGVERLLRHGQRDTDEDWWDKDTCKMRFRQVVLQLQSRDIVAFEPNSSIRNSAEFRFRREADQKFLFETISGRRRAMYSRIAGRWLVSAMGEKGNGATHELAAKLLTAGGANGEAGVAWKLAGDAARAARNTIRSISLYARARDCFGNEFAMQSAEALISVIRSRVYLGDFEAALEECSELLVLVGVERHPPQMVRAFLLQARIRRLVGDYQGAESALELGKSILDKTSEALDEDIHATLDVELREQEGRLTQERGARGSLEHCRRHYEYALAIRRRLGNSKSVALSLRYLARVMFEIDELESAKKYFEEAIELSESCGDSVGVASAKFGLGRVALDQGVLESAKTYVEEGLEIADKAGARLQSTMLLNLKGEIELMGGHFQPAEMALSEAISAAEEMGVRRVMVEVLVNRTLLSFALGNEERAVEWCDQGMQLAEEIDSRPLRVLILRARGIILAGVDRARAMSAFNRASAMLSAMGASRQLRTIEGLKGRLEG